MMTFLALTITFRTFRPERGPSTPPFLFLDVQTPSTPTAFFFPLDSSNMTRSTLNPSTNFAPAFAASGSQETTGPG